MNPKALVPLLVLALTLAAAAPAFASRCEDCINKCCQDFFGCGDPSIATHCRSNCTDEFPVCKSSRVNAFDPVATLSADGRRVHTGGPIECDEGARIQRLRVTITQQLTGAVAEGHTRGLCTGEEDRFEVDAPTRGEVTFVPGPAEACGLLTIADGGEITYADQWCIEISLEGN